MRVKDGEGFAVPGESGSNFLWIGFETSWILGTVPKRHILSRVHKAADFRMRAGAGVNQYCVSYLFAQHSLWFLPGFQGLWLQAAPRRGHYFVGKPGKPESQVREKRPGKTGINFLSVVPNR